MARGIPYSSSGLQNLAGLLVSFGTIPLFVWGILSKLGAVPAFSFGAAVLIFSASLLAITILAPKRIVRVLAKLPVVILAAFLGIQFSAPGFYLLALGGLLNGLALMFNDYRMPVLVHPDNHETLERLRNMAAREEHSHPSHCILDERTRLWPLTDIIAGCSIGDYLFLFGSLMLAM
jgi:hypothetical protein